ncbi:diguanylate cyclase domain-containing protein [Clostridium magnum]|uniref:Diguanylate cyclase DosC n=1 Tax=Clostridium magnum DSM 2767 TaxID=1121326 RepID=A0A162RAM9_9CLOT|nr:GGDEF domain-containing protein [Clostridium magnum]KZL89637.1 diguanylate cyclase DosC [Clostridium magnum DSM 2767]SHH74923.1 diguanylate cyclase (GGDEF) domain-containing protein [Clostridium magnum DSM 2767]
MQKILNIVDKNFIKVDILNGIRKIQNVFYEKNIECFAAYENKRLVGIVTKRELVAAHSNRIIADVMSDKYMCVNCYTHIWNIKELFDSDKNIDVIFVEDENDIIGFITRTTLNIELSKHIDSLTGLYKSNYIYCNSYNLIKSGQNTTVVFIDLNNFGYIDKTYGHVNGDIILQNVAKVLKDNTDSHSYLCRYGGDEFAILTSCCIEDSKRTAEKIINAINSYEFPNGIPISAAIGIASYKLNNNNNKISDIGDAINRLVNAASLASTKAKRDGNNSIIIENVDIDAIA